MADDTDDFIGPVFPEQNGDDFTPEKLTAYGDWLEQGERDFGPISERLDALNDAMFDEDWCPSFDFKYELKHLNDVLGGYHCAKYLKETRQTLDGAEADLARWRTLPQPARDAIIEADERAEAELAARRKTAKEITERKAAFYESMKLANVRPSPVLQWALDNMGNPFV
jgi:hypothetical protein